jgi:hypothetical protein
MGTLIKKTQEEYIELLWNSIKDFDLNTIDGKKDFVETIAVEIYNSLEIMDKFYSGLFEVVKKMSENQSNMIESMVSIREELDKDKAK